MVETGRRNEDGTVHRRKRLLPISPIATSVADIGAAIFLVLLAWISRDFFTAAWNNAQADQFPPPKCPCIAIAFTTLHGLLIIGSFAVFGIVTLNADRVVLGLGVMAAGVIAVIAGIIKITRFMSVKAKDLKTDQNQ